MTNKQLRAWYVRYNRKYFSDKLPKVGLRFRKIRHNDFGYTTFLGRLPVEIVIAKDVQGWGKLVRHILLHEMEHIRKPVLLTDGPAHWRRMRRLVAQGAFDGLL